MAHGVTSSNYQHPNLNRLNKSFIKAGILHNKYVSLITAGIILSKEILYQNMFNNSCQGMNISAPLYPVGSAANYTLLYLILRILTELPVKRVLELGAGQSTLLMDAIAKVQPSLDIITLETDALWADRIDQRVAHSVVKSSLRPTVHEGDCVETYGELEPLDGQQFDFVIVDGPMGTRKKSRWAALEILERNLANEFVVIFDDAERRGEQETIRKFISQHTSNIDFMVLNGKKAQFVAFTPQYRDLKFF
jgi:predicted O-methyltransferase YrrM